MKSAVDITYKELIREEEHNLARMKERFRSMVQAGQMNSHAARKRIALKEQLVKMLKQHNKDPQLNLYDLFHKI